MTIAAVQNTWNQGPRCAGPYARDWYPSTDNRPARPYRRVHAQYSLVRGGEEWKFIPHHLNVYSPDSGRAYHFGTIEELREFWLDRLDEGFVRAE